ncbi:MAG: hypothetical protein RDV48_15710 [Candidatus Eremiobacteraeota bacterium]|nr:hypothetical protein [Candidatus Eremiobacteraeota bacterium]
MALGLMAKELITMLTFRGDFGWLERQAWLNEDGTVACNPRYREAAHRAEVEGIATERPEKVTCKKCKDMIWKISHAKNRDGEEK